MFPTRWPICRGSACAFALPGRFREVRWFGRGPHENYPDRNASAMLGVWTRASRSCRRTSSRRSSVCAPTRRWLECIDPLTGRDAARRRAPAGRRCTCSATNYRAEDLFAAANEADLRPRDELVVHLDVAHRGLGTASCGPDVLPQYRLAAGEYTFAYRLTLHPALTPVQVAPLADECFAPPGWDETLVRELGGAIARRGL